MGLRKVSIRFIGRPSVRRTCSTKLFVAAAVVSVAACGGAIEPTRQPADSVARFFVSSTTSGECVVRSPGPTSARELRAASGERNVVVRLAVADEKCTGLGGSYLLAEEVDTKRVHWMGGHGCFPNDPSLKAPAVLGYGVARTTLTAALFSIPKETCVAFPGEPDKEFTSNERLKLAALFPTLEDARGYVDSIK